MRDLSIGDTAQVSGGVGQDLYFASLFGGSTFIYNVSSQYAASHPDHNMHVIVARALANTVIASAAGFLLGTYITYQPSMPSFISPMSNAATATDSGIVSPESA